MELLLEIKYQLVFLEESMSRIIVKLSSSTFGIKYNQAVTAWFTSTRDGFEKDWNKTKHVTLKRCVQ